MLDVTDYFEGYLMTLEYNVTSYRLHMGLDVRKPEFVACE